MIEKDCKFFPHTVSDQCNFFIINVLFENCSHWRQKGQEITMYKLVEMWQATPLLIVTYPTSTFLLKIYRRQHIKRNTWLICTRIVCRNNRICDSYIYIDRYMYICVYLHNLAHLIKLVVLKWQCDNSTTDIVIKFQVPRKFHTQSYCVIFF